MSITLLQLVSEHCRSGISLEESYIPLILEALLDPKVAFEIKAEFLRALTDKGETPAEAAAFVQALLPRAIDPGVQKTWKGEPLFDCCGPGGGGGSLFNLSTALLFPLAALGVPVVKHGNRGVTKKSGSADVLEALGIAVDLPASSLRHCLEEVGAAFLFAPTYHPVFKELAPLRQKLGQEGRRTIFNLLGPLLNPARPMAQLMGVFFPEQLAFFQEALQRCGVSRFLVVCGRAGQGPSAQSIGEWSLLGENTMKFSLPEPLNPEQWDQQQHKRDRPEDLQAVQVQSIEESAQRILAILEGKDQGVARELVEVNTAVALCIQGKVEDFQKAKKEAACVLDSGAARQVLETWRAFSLSQKTSKESSSV